MAVRAGGRTSTTSSPSTRAAAVSAQPDPGAGDQDQPLEIDAELGQGHHAWVGRTRPPRHQLPAAEAATSNGPGQGRGPVTRVAGHEDRAAASQCPVGEQGRQGGVDGEQPIPGRGDRPHPGGERGREGRTPGSHPGGTGSGLYEHMFATLQTGPHGCIRDRGAGWGPASGALKPGYARTVAGVTVALKPGRSKLVWSNLCS